jgi:hypothetical protein
VAGEQPYYLCPADRHVRARRASLHFPGTARAGPILSGAPNRGVLRRRLGAAEEAGEGPAGRRRRPVGQAVLFTVEGPSLRGVGIRVDAGPAPPAEDTGRRGVRGQLRRAVAAARRMCFVDVSRVCGFRERMGDYGGLLGTGNLEFRTYSGALLQDKVNLTVGYKFVTATCQIE